MSRPCRALINLKHLTENLALAQRLSGAAACLAVVKANAYGHGLVEVARHLEPSVAGFAVACSDEAVLLRRAGIRQPILLLEGAFSEGDLQVAIQQDCWLVVHRPEQVDWIVRQTPEKPLKIFLKVDSGMHRLGVPVDMAVGVWQRLCRADHVQQPVLLMSHFACADELTSTLSQQQMALMATLLEQTNAPLCLSNSAAIIRHLVAEQAYTRPGIMLYGSNPMGLNSSVDVPLAAVMSLQSEVIAIREIATGDSVGYGASWVAQAPSKIATVAVGYGDGYPRHAAIGTPVWIDGQLCPLVGRVSMDMITVDVTSHPLVRVGSAVELWGDNLSVDVVAAAAGTIGYELLTRMPARVQRVYSA